MKTIGDSGCSIRLPRGAGSAVFVARRVFRYLPLLPVREARAILPAGGTPLVSAPRIAARLGLAHVLIKDETRNPTRCLKDRATAVGMALAIECGRDRCVLRIGRKRRDFAGRVRGELRVSVPCIRAVVCFRARDWTGCERFGADIHVSEGNYDQAFEEAEQAGREHGWYSRNCAFNPFLVEGKKTCALEIAEEATTADFVIAPVGDGCTLGAIGKGFREARELGLIDRLPRLIGVQAAGGAADCRRVSAGRNRGKERRRLRPSRCGARGMRFGCCVRSRASDGEMIAVTDAEIGEAQRALAEEAGMVAEFTSAATLAALEALARRELLAGKTGVLVITGGRVVSGRS